MIKSHPAYKYAEGCLNGEINAPVYVKKQCAQFVKIANGDDDKYCIDENKVDVIGKFLKVLVVPKGLRAGNSVHDVLSGFQWLFIIAILCTVHRTDKTKRRYERAILEIARKNGKTFLIAVLFILLFLTEPKFSKFYSVAPDGSLSREVKAAIEEIIQSSPATNGSYHGKHKFKILRDYIHCNLTENRYIPLNYSNGHLDGKLPSVFLVDEAGGLPNAYAIEAMASGQLTILNKLGCIISTKYPTSHNPFEDEVSYCKKVLDKIVDDEKVFSLLYEPDDKTNWATNDDILEQANPLALDMPSVMEDIKDKRKAAVEVESKRENFVTKHCNIVYQGVGTETYIPVSAVRECRIEKIDWTGREVFLGVDLAMTTDNCAVAMAAFEDGKVYADVKAFIPSDRVDEKTRFEKVDYRAAIQRGECIACGDRVVDYLTIEQYVADLEANLGVKVLGIGFDRYNAISSAQKWESGVIDKEGDIKSFNTVEIKQHSSILHPPTKWLEELVLEKNFAYEKNDLLEINFENARCVYDTNLNRYVNKKRSNGKVDMVVSLINALYLLQQGLEGLTSWVAM